MPAGRRTNARWPLSVTFSRVTALRQGHAWAAGLAGAGVSAVGLALATLAAAVRPKGKQ
jgi:hypothetical protein